MAWMNSKGSKLANKTNFLNQQNLNSMSQKRGGRIRRNPFAATVTPVKPPTPSPIGSTSISVKPPTASPVAAPAANVYSQASQAPANPISISPQDIFDQQILGLVNQERAKVGADPLKINEQLDLAADQNTLDQASMNKMSHTGSNGSNMGARIKNAGYVFSSAGENVAYGFGDAAAVMNGWMNSEGHRQNILNPNYKEIGIGYAQGADGRPYWTQDFGSSLM
jgi:uncharacterized protein YkwD